MTQAKNILELKRKALDKNLCGEYQERWNSAQDIKDIIDIVTDPNGADFICASVANGWGCSEEYIKTLAEEYINGKYISYHKGYSSALYCGHKGAIKAETTVIIVIHSDVTIYVPKDVCVMIYTADSNVTVANEGLARIYDYGSEIETQGTGNATVMKAQDKKNSWINA